MKTKMVSVCMITYNHEQYVGQAIESVLKQATEFEFELVIGEDFSTDNTRIVCEKYAKAFPDKVRLLDTEHRKGMSANFLHTLKACGGKYIAFCEGDDFWIDTLKLQKQVEFLETNPEFVLSSTRYKIYDSIEHKFSDDSLDFKASNTDGIVFTCQENLWTWVTKTLTVVIKKDLLNFNDLKNYKYFRDVHLSYHILKYGKGYCHNFESGVYNQHNGGVWSQRKNEEKAKETYLVFQELYYNNRQDLHLRNRYLNSINTLIDATISCSKYPFVKISIYIYIFRYLFYIHSFSFLKMKILSLFGRKNQ